jgi:glycosyltransferase involved in cell wall biosynthesis
MSTIESVEAVESGTRRLSAVPRQTQPQSQSQSQPPAASASRGRAHVMYMVDRLYLQGGGEEALLRIVKTLPRDRFRISLVTFAANPEAARMVREWGADMHILPMRRVYDWNGFRTALELRRLMRSSHVDIVHTFFETSNTWGALVAKLSQVPVLVSSRRDMGILRLPKHHLAYKVINPFCDGFVAVSDGVRDFCIATEGLDPKRIFTVHNGVDLARIDAAEGVAALKARLGLPEGAPVVATVANIRKIKGLDTLLRAAAMVRREFPNVQFLVAGSCLEPDYFNELKAEVKEFGLTENVKFLGHFSEVFALLKLSHVFCLLSRTEGFSNAILEAMASSLPCVVTRVGGNAEAIDDGKNGFLLAPEDAVGAARRISALLRNPAEAQRIGRAARTMVEQEFTSAKMVEELAHLYESLLHGTAQGKTV